MKTVLENRIRQLKDEFEDFKKKVRTHKYVCLFGVGKAAEKWGYEFLKEYGTDNIICLSDNNSYMWGKTIVDGLKCIPPAELVQYGRDIICVISVQESLQGQIAMQLDAQGTEWIGLKIDWLGIDNLIEKNLNIKLPAIWERGSEMGKYDRDICESERVAVYTCIVNGYDELIQPKVCDPRCDYYCLSTEKPQHLGIYQWIDISNMVPEYLEGDFTRINRYFKVHPHLLFAQYNYSIYIDGNLLVKKELSGLTRKIGRIGIALYGLPAFLDTYEHASAICFMGFKGEKRETIRKQMQRYVSEGFPRYFGLSENSVMVREHHNRDCIRIMNTWWDEIRNCSRRDQLSLFYSIWKNGFVTEDVGYIDATFRNGPEFSAKLHCKDTNVMRFNR